MSQEGNVDTKNGGNSDAINAEILETLYTRIYLEDN